MGLPLTELPRREQMNPRLRLQMSILASNWT